MSAPAALRVVGLGPGEAALLAPEALAALHDSQVIAGYGAYLDLIDPALLADKEVIVTGMTGEMRRVNAAIDSALAGRATALVCSGDPGIYALAGLALELLEERGIVPDALPFIVVPGIPALCAAAAILGAPLTHDFACVSLSDLLTPWALIRKRLDCAFAGDFVVVLYNPRSKRRVSQLDEALELALAHRRVETPVGLVRNAKRKGEQAALFSLGTFDPSLVDMLSLVIVGNSQSRIVPGSGKQATEWASGARLLTPRGYLEKYGNT
ncbi:precorrin-3B C(17)-methyltransferase [Desulfovibrio sp. OttesenSCG-928-F20]|nr:precorrin-3B C(17)-methyltransferase [Desulfovibrio sp. OttesenSCG-928-F20]